jgi:hypothetical protein
LAIRGYDGIRLSFKIGLAGGAVAIGASIFQLVLRIRTIFWWSISVPISGEALLVTGAIGLFAGIFGVYGASIGKKRGAGIMIVTGALISIATSFSVMLFGLLLFFGGIIALTEKPQKNN